MTSATAPAWREETLPGCFGHPCETLRMGARAVRVWQASKVTARGVWIWRLDDGGNRITRGNRGAAKSAARRVLVVTVRAGRVNSYRCQFCERETPAREWKNNKCPKCGRAYDPILAQEGDGG